MSTDGVNDTIPHLKALCEGVVRFKFPNRGISWMSRYSGSSCGTFRDLVPYNGKIVAVTDKGVYYSSNKGISWMCRNSSSQAKTFIAMELLAQTSDGHLYYSTNEGISWMRRR